MNNKIKLRDLALFVVSLIIILLPIARILIIKWNNLFLLDFAAYCSVSRALFSGNNPFPNHMEVLMVSFGKDVPIVYPGQMLLFALPSFLWGNTVQVAYLALNILLVWVLTAWTLVRSCGYEWKDIVQPGLKQFLFAICASCFMSSFNVMQTMRIGQIPVVLAFCLYSIFWLKKQNYLRSIAFALIAVAKYSCLTVFAPLLFAKGHRRFCIFAFSIFVFLSISPVFCGNNLMEVYRGYSEAVVNIFKPGSVNHYSSIGVNLCHLGFFKNVFLNQFLKVLFICPVIWMLCRERKTRCISDTALLLALSVTMLVSYHVLHDATLIFPLFFIRLFAFAKEKNWLLFVITALFPVYLLVPGRIIEWFASVFGRIPHIDSIVYLSNPMWNVHYHNLYPISSVYTILLALWSLYLYRHVNNTYCFDIDDSERLKCRS